jgi:hypothetical protein
MAFQNSHQVASKNHAFTFQTSIQIEDGVRWATTD